MVTLETFHDHTHCHDNEEHQRDVDVGLWVAPVLQDGFVVQVLCLSRCPCDVAEQLIDGLTIGQLEQKIYSHINWTSGCFPVFAVTI